MKIVIQPKHVSESSPNELNLMLIELVKIQSKMKHLRRSFDVQLSTASTETVEDLQVQMEKLNGLNKDDINITVKTLFSSISKVEKYLAKQK